MENLDNHNLMGKIHYFNGPFYIAMLNYHRVDAQRSLSSNAQDTTAVAASEGRLRWLSSSEVQWESTDPKTIGKP